MTRLGLLSTFLTAPLLSVLGVKAVAKEDEVRVAFGPGTYKIAPGGGIQFHDSGRVSIKNCTFHDCTFEPSLKDHG